MDVSLNSNALEQLNTTEAKALHDISDSLSACGVGKIVNLPQIIVVGEQSAGKSSVLEAISHVRFPVDGSLCTRFATELVLRQANETRVDVSVRFADKSKAAQAFQRKGFREDDLPEIIKEAKECMGFARAGKEFSKDVLRLEIEGPKMYPLSLVDLPGFFHTDTDTQSLGGKETVDELVESYMRQKNSIILVVITANNNLANHVALHKVKTMDPQRQRTIGVITKPDLTRTASADERTYIRVAKNQEGAHKLHLGWHVLRNRAEDESSLETRDKTEELFFETGAWATIPKEDRGITGLRRKLSRVLYNHIRQSLPGVVEDIETMLRERQEDLSRLGNPRSEHNHWRSFLLTIAGDFQRLARDGCYGRYNDPFFGSLDEDDRKFRAQLRNFNRVFDHVLRTKGSTQNIISSDGDDHKEEELPQYLEDFLRQYPYDFPYPETINSEELKIELERKAAANQGREFPGSPNADLAMQLFRKQAAPWKQIAQYHVECVITVAKAFVDQTFKHVIGSPHNNPTTEAILATCVDPFFEEKENSLREKIEELLRPYSEGYSFPLDFEFYRVFSERSSSRLANQICEALEDNYPEVFREGSQITLTPERITQAMVSNTNLCDGEFGTDKVVDMMSTYYEMCRRTFTDNVINLAIESCLVRGIPDILTPTQVDRMSTERLQELAAEPIETTSRRNSLQAEVEILRQGLAQCRRYRPRTVTGMGCVPAMGPTGTNQAVLPSSKPSSPAPKPTAVPSVLATASKLASSTPTPLFPSSSGSNLTDVKSIATGQTPVLATTTLAPVVGSRPNSGTAVTNSKPDPKPMSPAPKLSSNPLGNPSLSSSPSTFGSNGSTGGLFGGRPTIPWQPNTSTASSQGGFGGGFGAATSQQGSTNPTGFGFGTSTAQQPLPSGGGLFGRGGSSTPKNSVAGFGAFGAPASESSSK